MNCPVCDSILSPGNDLDITISIHIIECLVSRIDSMNDYIRSLSELMPLATQIAYLPRRITTFPDVESPFS